MDNIFRVISIISLFCAVYVMLQFSSLSKHMEDLALANNISPKVDVKSVKVISQTLKKLSQRVDDMALNRKAARIKDVTTIKNPVALSKDAIEKMIDSHVSKKITEIDNNKSRTSQFGITLFENVPKNDPYAPQSREEVMQRLNLDNETINEFKKIQEEQEKVMSDLFKNEGETDEEFMIRMLEMKGDKEKESAYAEEMKKKMLQGDSLIKMMKAQSSANKKIEKLLGDDTYNEYKKLISQIPNENSQGISIQIGK